MKNLILKGYSIAENDLYMLLRGVQNCKSVSGIACYLHVAGLNGHDSDIRQNVNQKVTALLIGLVRNSHLSVGKVCLYLTEDQRFPSKQFLQWDKDNNNELAKTNYYCWEGLSLQHALDDNSGWVEVFMNADTLRRARKRDRQESGEEEDH